ncbi:MAG: GDP-mannose 4,6-dehydratase [Solirubrobacteraceae bacterium]
MSAHPHTETGVGVEGQSSADGEPRRALITGITGQDGSFLAELLLGKGYAVTGVVRGEAAEPGGDRTQAESAGDMPMPDVALGCSKHLRGQVELVHGDLLEPDTLRTAIERVCPHEIYHLAAPSFVPTSWEHPRETVVAIAGSAAAVLEAGRELVPDARVFVPASGAIYGDAPESPQREDTVCRPTTPYALARLAAHQLVGVMRAHDGLHASSGIVFNHESERRPERFVTRRITRAVAAISLGLRHELTLGDTSAVRDWSFAGDIVYGAWLMLQQEQPDDYVLASGVAHTVAEFARAAFACVDLDAERYLRVDSALIRPPETTASVGDPSKAHERLGWTARVSFEQLVQRMVQADLRELGAGALA